MYNLEVLFHGKPSAPCTVNHQHHEKVTISTMSGKPSDAWLLMVWWCSALSLHQEKCNLMIKWCGLKF